MSSGSLPVRAEVTNVGVAGGTVTLDMFCTSVASGGLGIESLAFSRATAVAGIATTTTFKPIISLRAGTLLGGTAGGGSITNRGLIKPTSFAFIVSSNSHEVQVLYNPTLTDPSFLPNGTASLADYDLSATAVTGGTILDTEYIASGTGAVRGVSTAFYEANPLVYSGLNGVQNFITIAARTLTGTGTINAAISWREQY